MLLIQYYIKAFLYYAIFLRVKVGSMWRSGPTRKGEVETVSVKLREFELWNVPIHGRILCSFFVALTIDNLDASVAAGEG